MNTQAYAPRLMSILLGTELDMVDTSSLPIHKFTITHK